MAQNNNLNIYIDKDTDKEFEVLLQKQPYMNEKEISELFSHLVHIDEAQREKIFLMESLVINL